MKLIDLTVNHKGGNCPYKAITCQEGYCQDCEIYNKVVSMKEPTQEQDELLLEEYMMLLQTQNGGKVIVDTRPALKAQLAKVKKLYPIMYREEADEDRHFIERDWTPPAEALKHGPDKPELRKKKIVNILTSYKNWVLNFDKGRGERCNLEDATNQLLALYPDIDLLWKLDADRNWSMCEWLKTLPKYFEVIKEEAKKQEGEKVIKEIKGIENPYKKPIRDGVTWNKEVIEAFEQARQTILELLGEKG